MVLATHAIVGASIASIIPSHPVLGFTVGFASHFLLDAIPHWEYSLASWKKDYNNPMNSDIIVDKNFIFDLFKTGVDAVFGLLATVFLFSSFSNFYLASAAFWGAVGAMIPDGLQFIYFKWRHEPMTSLQRFHFWTHSNIRLDNRPVLGIFTQIVIIIFSVAISKLVD